jgi:hypothetical protein
VRQNGLARTSPIGNAQPLDLGADPARVARALVGQVALGRAVALDVALVVLAKVGRDVAEVERHAARAQRRHQRLAFERRGRLRGCDRRDRGERDRGERAATRAPA